MKQEVDELKGENVRLTSKLFALRHSYDSLVKDQNKIVKKQKREERKNTNLKQDLTALNARLEGLIHNFQIQNDEMEHLIREGEDKVRKERVQQLEEDVNYLAGLFNWKNT